MFLARIECENALYQKFLCALLKRTCLLLRHEGGRAVVHREKNTLYEESRPEFDCRTLLQYSIELCKSSNLGQTVHAIYDKEKWVF